MLDGIYSQLYRNSALRGAWYSYLSRLDRMGEAKLMNFGYACIGKGEEPIILKKDDELNRYGFQLYHCLAKEIDWRKKEALEIGCGRGGGAEYLAKYFKPKSLLGMDACGKAVEFCKKNYSVEGLSFTEGNAEKLGFADCSFDAVVNVESSHCYASMEKFLSEVHRVLRPGGFFLFADFREKNEVNELHKKMGDSGLEITVEKNITPNVAKAIELDSERKLALIKKLVPGPLQRPYVLFSGITGTPAHASLKNGGTEYIAAVMRKPCGKAPKQTAQGQ